MAKITSKETILFFLGVAAGLFATGIYGIIEYFTNEFLASIYMICFALIIAFVLWQQFIVANRK